MLTKGLGASPGAAVGPRLPDCGQRRRGRGEGGDGAAGAPRDLTGRRAGHAGRGNPHRSGRTGEPRGGRGPGLGEAGRRRSRVAPDLRAPADRGGRHHRRGRLAVDRRHIGLGRPGPGAPQPGGPSVGVLPVARVGGRDPDGAPRRPRQRRHGARRPPGPPARRRRHRPVPHRAHVPRRGPASGGASDDPCRYPRAGGKGPGGAPGGATGGLRRHPGGDGRAARDGAAPRPPLHEFLPDTGELAIKDATVGLSPEERKLFEAAKQWQEANPMLGTAGGPPRGHQAGPLRDAGAGPDGGRVRPSGVRRHPRRGDHDPAHGLARGARPGSQLGRGGRRGDLPGCPPG